VLLVLCVPDEMSSSATRSERLARNAHRFVSRLPVDHSWATCYLRTVRSGERPLTEVVAQSGRRRGHRGQSTDFRDMIRF